MDEQQIADTPDSGPAELTVTDAASRIEALLGSPESTTEQPERAQEHRAPERAPEREPAREAQPEPETNAPEPAPADNPEPKYKVKVQGEEVEVPLSELLKGYSRQSDYSRKTEALSQEAQALQHQRATVEHQRAQYEQGLQQAASVLQAQLAQFQNVNWQQMADTDPIGYLQAKERQREIHEALQGTQMQAQQLYAQKVSERHDAFGKLLQSETEKVLAALPEWREPEKAKSEQSAIRDYLVKNGFDERELYPQTDPRTGDITSPGLVDHRALLMARKAMLYDQQMGQVDAAVKRVAPLPKTIQRPGTEGERMGDRELTLRRFNQSGSMQDAVAAIAARL